MTNEEKAKEIQANDVCCVWNSGCPNVYHSALEMAEWKDKQLWLLIDSIDHVYLQTDGTYGDLSLEVVDKVKYLKNQRRNSND